MEGTGEPEKTCAPEKTDDYNYLKSLPKDILIKLITELEENFIKSRKEWFSKTVRENIIDCCQGEDCYKILHEYSENLFTLCGTCNEIICKECAEKRGITYNLFESCGEIKVCSKCKKCYYCRFG